MKTKSCAVFALTIFILLVGCATAHRISMVSMGMTKQEVVKTIGKPVSTSAQGSVEYLNYAFSETDDDAFNGRTTPYYVRLVNGHVESYGRTGDFDSTKTPTIRIETDERIRKDANTRDSGDLYAELKKLKDLKDSGILTDQEFEIRKKKLLETY